MSGASSPQVKQQLLVDVTGELFCYAERGRPDSSPAPTVTVYDGGDAQLTALHADLTAAAATLGAFSQAVTADASRGAKALTVASTASLVVGDRLFATNHKRQSEEVAIEGYDSGTVYLADPLEFDYDASGTPTPQLASHRLSVEVDAALLTDVVRNARAVFTYHHQGRRFDQVVWYDVVLQRAYWPVTAADLREIYFEFPEVAGPESAWRRYVEGARRDLERKLEAAGFYPDLLRNAELAKGYITARVMERFFATQGERFRDTRYHWSGEVKEAFSRIQLYFAYHESADDLLDAALEAL